MKKIWNWGLLAIGVIVVGVLLFLNIEKTEIQIATLPTSPIPNTTNSFKPIVTTSKPATAFTPDEKAALERAFAGRFKPAIDKWANAYAGHLPFDASQITLEKFHSVNAGFYTFMIGDTTFTVFDNRKGTKVFYLMAKQAAKDLNTIPADGKPRNLTVPIKRDEVLKMAMADTGLNYELKDVVIKPTATFCNIDGGAEVEVGIKYENGMQLILPDNLSFVMDSNGTLISYQH
jgi:hypothetical protein